MSGQQKVTNDHEINFNVQSDKQEMTKDCDINFGVPSGKLLFIWAKTEEEQGSVPRQRGLCGVCVRPMESVDGIHMTHI